MYRSWPRRQSERSALKRTATGSAAPSGSWTGSAGSDAGSMDKKPTTKKPKKAELQPTTVADKAHDLKKKALHKSNLCNKIATELGVLPFGADAKKKLEHFSGEFKLPP